MVEAIQISMNIITIDTTRKPREGERNGKGELLTYWLAVAYCTSNH